MAGLPARVSAVVLAAVEAVCNDAFNIHGVLATTMPVGPVLIVNGPIRRRIAMNSGKNVFGQGNRANATIGRALQLVVRNVGGGGPARSTARRTAIPGKLGFCFAEDEEGSPWTPLASDFGAAPGTDAVTAFTGEGPRCIVDQLSRDPDSLARTFAVNLRTLHHPSSCSRSTACSRSARALADLPRGGLEQGDLLARSASCSDPGQRARARRGRHRRRGCPSRSRAATLPKFRPGRTA
jgi:hypothetical protein